MICVSGIGHNGRNDAALDEIDNAHLGCTVGSPNAAVCW